MIKPFKINENVKYKKCWSPDHACVHKIKTGQKIYPFKRKSLIEGPA